MTLEEENVILSYLSPFSLHEYHPKYHFRTRLHSSRMCTTRTLTVSWGVWGVYLPGLGGTCLVWGVPAWSGGVYLPSPGGVYLPGLGGYLPSQGGYLPGPGGVYWSGTPPCGQNSWHTLLKILPCPKLRLRSVKMGNRGWRHRTEVRQIFTHSWGLKF